MNPQFRKNLFIAVAIFLLGFQPTMSAAQRVGDGFELSRSLKSRYFTIYVKDGANLERAEMALTVPAALRALAPTGVSGGGLEGEADLLYLAVSEILQIRLKNFSSTLKICNDAGCLEDVAMKLFGQRIKAGGFYVVAIDSLYMDADNISLYIFGHELAHALIAKYFVVPPPERLQEVLAGYVEYEMRKYTGMMPGASRPLPPS